VNQNNIPDVSCLFLPLNHAAGQQRDAGNEQELCHREFH
jgi:hypothetical protein